MIENKTSKLPYLIIVGIAIITIIALIIIKINVPTFKLGTMFIIASIIIVILVGIGFAVVKVIVTFVLAQTTVEIGVIQIEEIAHSASVAAKS